jgi:hypothetical protein
MRERDYQTNSKGGRGIFVRKLLDVATGHYEEIKGESVMCNTNDKERR